MNELLKRIRQHEETDNDMFLMAIALSNLAKYYEMYPEEFQQQYGTKGVEVIKEWLCK